MTLEVIRSPVKLLYLLRIPWSGLIDKCGMESGRNPEFVDISGLPAVSEQVWPQRVKTIFRDLRSISVV